jgi:hypothetical protein
MDTFKNVKNIAYGAIGDGSSYDTLAIISAISSSASGSIVYFPTGIYKISGSLTLGRGQQFYFDSNARLLIDTGSLLTIDGVISGDMGTKFSGQGNVLFGYASLNSEVPITWFGVDNNSSGGDQSATINKALSSFSSGNGQVVKFPTGQYTVGNQITIPKTVARLKLIGEGFSKSVIVYTPPSTGSNVCISIPVGYDRFEMQGIGISAIPVSGKRSIGIQFETTGSGSVPDTTETYLTDVDIYNFNQYGINVVPSAKAIYVYIDRCRFDNIQNSVALGGDNSGSAYAINGGTIAVASIQRTRFAACDGAIRAAGFMTSITNGSAIEQCGSTTRLNSGHIVDIFSGFCTLDNVWAEINYTSGSTYLMRFSGSDSTRVSNCCFGCESSGGTKTYNLALFDTKAYGNIFMGNRINGIDNVKFVTVDSTATPVKMQGNTFYNNSSIKLTLLSDIQSHITSDRCDLSMYDGDDNNAPTAYSYYGTGDSSSHQKLKVQSRASTNPSVGYGTSLGFHLSRNNGGLGPTSPVEAGNVTVKWENATAGVEQGNMRFNLSLAGAVTDVAGFNSYGIFDCGGHIVKSKLLTGSVMLNKWDGDCYLNANGIIVGIQDASLEPDRKRTFKLIQAGSGSITGSNIEGSTVYQLTSINKYVTLHSVNSVWRVIAAG